MRDLQQDPSAQAALDALQVRCSKCQSAPMRRAAFAHHLAADCPQEPAACQHCGFEELRAVVAPHEVACPSRPLPCPNAAAGCVVALPSDALAAHAAGACPFQPTTCSDCAQPMALKDLGDHAERACPAALPCRARTSGCPWRGSSADLAAHHAACPAAAQQAQLVAGAQVPGQTQDWLEGMDWEAEGAALGHPAAAAPGDAACEAGLAAMRLAQDAPPAAAAAAAGGQVSDELRTAAVQLYITSSPGPLLALLHSAPATPAMGVVREAMELVMHAGESEGGGGVPACCQPPPLKLQRTGCSVGVPPCSSSSVWVQCRNQCTLGAGQAPPLHAPSESMAFPGCSCHGGCLLPGRQH